MLAPEEPRRAERRAHRGPMPTAKELATLPVSLRQARPPAHPRSFLCQSLEHGFGVAVDLHALPDVRDLPFFVEGEGAANDALHLFAVHRLHPVGAERLVKLELAIREQGNLELVLAS